MIKKCKFCGKEFESNDRREKYCSWGHQIAQNEFESLLKKEVLKFMETTHADELEELKSQLKKNFKSKYSQW
jgi:hypothetical protein